MAVESELGRLYVAFAAKGDKQLDKAIDAKRTRLQQAAASAMVFGRSLAVAVESSIQRVGGLAQRVLVVGGLLKGLVLGAGMSGTKEAETMSNAFTLLARVIADIFAPAIRGAIQVMIELARWIISLDKETKSNILGWTLFAAAVTGALAVLPGVVTVLKGLVSVLSVVPGKWGLVALAIGGVVAALEYLSDATLSWENKTLSALGHVAAGWQGLKGFVGGAVSALTGGNFKEGFREWSGLNQEMERYLKNRGLTESAKSILREKYPNDPAFKPGEEEKRAAGFIERWKAAFKGAFDGSENTPMGRIMKAIADGKPLQVKHNIDILSFQSAWEKMQKSTTGDKQDKQIEQLEQIRRGIALINERGVRIADLPPVVA